MKSSIIVMGERAWVINCFVMSMELKSPNFSFKLDRISDLEEEDVTLMGMCWATISLKAISSTHSSSLKYWSYTINALAHSHHIRNEGSIQRILQTFLLANDSLRMANQLFFFCRDRFDHLIVELRAILSNLSQQLRHHPSPDLLPTSNFSSFDSERQPLIVCSRYCIYS